MIVFNPRVMEAQLQNDPPCPEYHWMMINGNNAGCSFKQQTIIQMDFVDQPASELLTKKVVMEIKISPTTSPPLPYKFIDEAMTKGSINPIFSSWTPTWDINQITGKVSLTLATGTAVPVEYLYNPPAPSSTSIFTIFMHGTPNTTYTYTYEASGTALILEPNNLGCEGTHQIGKSVTVPNYIPILLGGTVEFMNNDIADGVCSAIGGFPNLDILLYKTLDPITPLDHDETNTSGLYRFKEVVSDCEYQIVPVIGQDDDYCGVTGSDLVELNGHILGIPQYVFTDIWQYMAGDVDLDGFITTADVTLLQTFILGGINVLPDGWRFMDRDLYNGYQTNGFLPPLTYNEFIKKTFLSTSLTEDFAGVKCGDLGGISDCNICNISFTGSGSSGTRESKNKTIFDPSINQPPSFDNSELVYTICTEKLEEINCDVFVDIEQKNTGILSLIITNPGFEILETNSSQQYKDEIFQSVIDKDKQNVRFICSSNSPTKNEAIARIKLNRTKNSYGLPLFKLDQRIGFNYTSTKTGFVNLKMNNALRSKHFSLDLIISPNPVKNLMNLHLISNEITNGIITVYNMTGKVVSTESIVLTKGLNNLTFNDLDLPSSGTYLLQLKTENDVVTSKFIKQ